MAVPFRNDVILNCFTIFLLYIPLAIADRPFYKPAYEATTVSFDCTNFTQKYTKDGFHFVTWETPNGNIIENTTTQLTITSVTQSDAGKYICLLAKTAQPDGSRILNPTITSTTDNSKGKEIKRQVFEIPYVIVPKDYGRATWVGLLVAGSFLLVCIGLMLITKYTYENRNDEKVTEVELEGPAQSRTNQAFDSDDRDSSIPEKY